MAFDFAPVNYAGMLGLQNQADPWEQKQRQQVIDLQRQQQQAQVRAAQAKAQQERAYQADVAAVLTQPTTEGFAALQLRYPEQANAIKGAFEQREKAAQDSDFRDMTKLYGLAKAGRIDDAKKTLQGRIDAGKAAGVDVSDDEELLVQFNENPDKAANFLGYVISSIGGTAKFAAIQEQLRLADGGGEAFTLGPGDARYDANGKLIAQSEFKPQFMTDPRTGAIISLTPNGGAGGASGPLTVETLRPHFIAQESSGNYKARNAETGAMGAYQVMPETGRNLAKQLGIPWRPALMLQDTPEARAYQDQIGGAAIQDAINGGGGKAEDVFSYYYGGSDRRKWGPRTRQYAGEMVARLGGGSQGGGYTVTQVTGGKPPEPKTTILTPEEVAAIPGLDPGAVYQRKPDGTISAVGNSRPQLKPPPGKAMDGYVGNRTSIFKIDDAWKAVRAAKNATGAKGYTPNFILQRTDPNGVAARAAVADIGSLLIHDRSGAAVTISETPRLLPFVPQVTDDMPTIEKKLNQLRRALQNEQADIEDTYSAEQGFRFPRYRKAVPPQLGGDRNAGQPRQGGSLPVLTPEQARAAPKGTRFRTSDGRVMVRQ